MNKWECQSPGCRSTCVGVGGAIGLRAIGWYFKPGYQLFCPFHYPDADVRHVPIDADDEKIGQRCGPCTATRHGSYWQALMKQLGTPDTVGWE